jgi:hypothetical protein
MRQDTDEETMMMMFIMVLIQLSKAVLVHVF